jgi:hypothetical protein
MVTYFHEKEIEGEIEEIEEIRGLNNKSFYEDEFMAFFSVRFCEFNFGALFLYYLYSLILLHT